MKLLGYAIKRMRKVAVCALLLCLTATEVSQAQRYQVGQVVTNFTVHSRRGWTNSAGTVFGKGTPMRLRDFSGKVLFVEFFDPT